MLDLSKSGRLTGETISFAVILPAASKIEIYSDSISGKVKFLSNISLAVSTLTTASLPSMSFIKSTP